MKTNISKSKVWQIIGVAVLCALCVLGSIFGVVFGMLNSNGNSPSPDDISGNPVIFDVVQESDILLASSATTVADDGTTTQTLTATILPATAAQSFDWSISFANAESDWATGKTVTDYVTLTNEGGSNTATLTCLQGFSEQIIVKVAAVADSTKFATATIDYANRVSSFSFKVYKDGVDNDGFVLFDDIGHIYTFECELIYDEIGTKKVGTPSFTYGFTPDAVKSVHMKISGLGEFGLLEKTYDGSESFNSKFPERSDAVGALIANEWFSFKGSVASYPNALLAFKNRFSNGRNGNGSMQRGVMRIDCSCDTDYFSFKKSAILPVAFDFDCLKVSSVSVSNSNITF